MKKYLKIRVLLILMISGGCNNFTDLEPVGIITPETTEDYDLMLNGLITISDIVTRQMYLQTDQLAYTSRSSVPKSSLDRAFIWGNQIYSVEKDYKVWSDPYNNIYSYNLIINNVLTSTGGSQAFQQQLKAEALVCRAVEYFYLVNTFGNAYSKNATTDLGVPFVSVADAAQKVPSRSTVAQIYNQLITEIQEAIPSLVPLGKVSSRFRASKEGAEGLLARLYYYKNDYSNALAYANKVLAVSNTLLNYNTLPDYSDDFGAKRRTNPEEIFIRETTDSGFLEITAEFTNLFGDNDLRLAKQFSDYGDYFYTQKPSVGISVPEMLLIKAEAEARLDNLTGAVTTLNTLREKRSESTGYMAFSSTNKEEIITKILTERRLELYFMGLRWFDMKKQAKEGRLGTIVHKAFGKDYKLEPNSLKYTLQIPQIVLNLSPHIKQNPR